MAPQGFVERLRRRVVVSARASLRLGHDLLDHAHADDLAGGQLQLLRRLDLARVVAPDDRGGRFRRGDGIDRVLEHDHAVRDAHPQGASAAAFTDHGGDDRHGDPEPLHDRRRDRGGDAALLRARAGVRPRGVDERDDREAELRRVMRQPQRLAVSLGMHHPPVPRHALLQAAPLLVAEEHRRPAVPGADAAGQRRVVR